ncbi:MAG: efflux transporter outer membrane subunit [Steroidobacteraceae bacterium]|jgi:multidrug efflux system outer membrane protein
MLVVGCAVGPDYHRPSADVPTAWKPEAPWHEAAPSDDTLKGSWWEVFEDPTLSSLIEQSLKDNQNLRVAAAHLAAARSEVTVAASALYPYVGLSAEAGRGEISANRPLSAYSTPNFSTTQNDVAIGPTVDYEPDLFGRVRREVEGAKASAQQAQADFENTRLMLTAQLAADYFSVRELDAEIDVVRRSIELQRKALDFVTARHDLGYATGLDLAQQQALLESSATQLELLQNQRAQTEHAIATLVGTAAPNFTLAPSALAAGLPVLPVGLPSDLLQRRPDVASAERAMAAANAQIGVAKAAYFPTIDLLPIFGGPAFGWQSNALSTLIQAPSVLWSIGLSATQTLFDAGKTRANVRIARADYEGSVATYRQTVLSAMEEVENGITGLASLHRASTQAEASVRDEQRAFDIASERYQDGVDTYLDVITAEQTLLTDQRQAVQIRGQQFTTAVYLIKALGGGWELPPSTASVAR